MPTWSIAPGSSAGVSSSASISSSDSSVSLRPSESKNLTPLYSGGLCEAEMTAPRSSASSATAGVGRTPARTALPPAATIPRAKASSSSEPEARVSRPTKMRPPCDQSVAARPSRSTSSSVMSSPTTPRTPSVPKYRLDTAAETIRAARLVAENARNRALRAGSAALALGELRRLARLVQAGLLALDDACVARQEACPLQRHAQLRVGLDERPGDAVADGARLSARPAAVHPHAEVERPFDARDLEPRQRHVAVRGAREVLPHP